MKNADKPAYPLVYADMSTGTGEVYCDEHGLTKREMFAMNAPEISENFFRDWNETYQYDPKLFTYEGDILPKGELMRLRDWSYAYADMMLETGENEKPVMNHDAIRDFCNAGSDENSVMFENELAKGRLRSGGDY